MVFIIVVCIVMYLLNYLAPMYSDNWLYVFIFGTDNSHIHSLWDVVKSQCSFYNMMNGRITAQSLAQLVDSMVGKPVFNVLNTAMFIVFLYAVAINVTHNRRSYYAVFSVTFILVFLLMPGFDLGFLWLTGAMNYLWSATMVLFFHYLLLSKTCSGRYYIPLFLYGFVCGLTNEAFVFGLAGGYFLYFATHRRELSPQRTIMLVGFFIGALILVLSPGSFQRAVGHHEVRSKMRIFQALWDMNNLRIFFLTIIAIPLMAVFRQLKLGRWLKQEQLLVTALVLSLVFIWLTLHASEHSRIGIELFSMMLLLRVIPWNRVSNTAITIANVATLVVAVCAIHASYLCHQANRQELAQVERREYPVVTTMPHYAFYLNRYIVPYAFCGIGERHKLFGHDDVISKYFDNDSIFFVPREFFMAAKKHPQLFNKFYTEPRWPFYAIREDEVTRSADYAMLNLEPMDYTTLRWPMRWFAPYLKDYNLNNLPLSIQRCTIDDNTYILVLRINSLDFRFKDIELIRRTQ